jgi:hypothetical protein
MSSLAGVASEGGVLGATALGFGVIASAMGLVAYQIPRTITQFSQLSFVAQRMGTGITDLMAGAFAARRTGIDPGQAQGAMSNIAMSLFKYGPGPMQTLLRSFGIRATDAELNQPEVLIGKLGQKAWEMRQRGQGAAAIAMLGTPMLGIPPEMVQALATSKNKDDFDKAVQKAKEILGDTTNLGDASRNLAKQWDELTLKFRKFEIEVLEQPITWMNENFDKLTIVVTALTLAMGSMLAVTALKRWAVLLGLAEAGGAAAAGAAAGGTTAAVVEGAAAGAATSRFGNVARWVGRLPGPLKAVGLAVLGAVGLGYLAKEYIFTEPPVYSDKDLEDATRPGLLGDPRNRPDAVKDEPPAYKTDLLKAILDLTKVIKDWIYGQQKLSEVGSSLGGLGAAIGGALGGAGGVAAGAAASLAGHIKRRILGGGGGGAALKPEQQANAQIITDAFRAIGFSDDVIAGVLRNVQSESRFNPRAVGSGAGEISMFQFNADNKAAYLRWLNGRDQNDPRLQTEFALKLLQTRRYRALFERLLHGGLSKEQAALAWLHGYEQPSKYYENQRAGEYAGGVPNLEHYLPKKKAETTPGDQPVVNKAATPGFHPGATAFRARFTSPEELGAEGAMGTHWPRKWWEDRGLMEPHVGSFMPHRDRFWELPKHHEDNRNQSVNIHSPITIHVSGSFSNGHDVGEQISSHIDITHRKMVRDFKTKVA